MLIYAIATRLLIELATLEKLWQSERQQKQMGGLNQFNKLQAQGKIFA